MSQKSRVKQKTRDEQLGRLKPISAAWRRQKQLEAEAKTRELQKQLKVENEQKRTEASTHLGESGKPETSNPLMSALGNAIQGKSQP